MNSIRLQKELRDYIDVGRWAGSFAATLTLKQARHLMTDFGSSVRVAITEEIASRNFRHFINLLSSKVYGTSSKRFGRRVRAIPVLEGGAGLRLHYHAMIDCPREELATVYPQMIEQCWQQTDWGYDQVHVTTGADLGWVRYMTKLRSKRDFACSIDWMNFAN